ncbi:unnamed protein product, partial [marine sediment metagenome]
YAGKLETLKTAGKDVTNISLKNINLKYAELSAERNSRLNDAKSRVKPVRETDDLAEPKKTKSIESRESEVEIRKAAASIKATPKMEQKNWKKAIKAPLKHVAGVVKKLKAKVGAERFNEILEQYAGLKNGTKELEAMINMTFEAKSKKELNELLSKIEDSVHKVETVTRPEEGKLSYVTRSPNQGESSISKYRNFRDNISAYKRGDREARSDMHDKAMEIYDFVSKTLPQRSVDKVLSTNELKALARPLPKNASPKQIVKKLEQIDKLFEKL